MLCAAFPFAVTAAVIDNTNNIAVAILSYAAMDNEDDLDADEECPVRYTDWNGMLDAVALPGLTRQDKDAALTGYLMAQSTNSLSSVDDDFVFVTRSFLSNTSVMARESKPTDLLCLGNAINRHRETLGKDTAYTNALNLVYQFRGLCPESAIALDRLYISQIDGYELSSNRLETVRGWLESTNCTSEVRAHCAAVTNQLMNVGQPLTEVESLRGL